MFALPPKLRAAVEEAIAVTQAPPALVASSALGAASLAVQAQFDVIRMDGLKSPCSLFLITFAESGERKTTVDRLFFGEFSAFEEQMNDALAAPTADAPDVTTVIDVQASDNTFDADQEGSNEHANTAPPKPTRPITLLYADTTPAAFVAGLAENSRSAGLCEDEAGRIFEGRLVNDLGLLTKAWNGSDIVVDRRHGRFKIRDPRCTISWMVQPQVFQAFMQRKGENARGIGFLSRCLVCYPISKMGFRPSQNNTAPLDSIAWFNSRTLELLKSQVNQLCADSQKAKSDSIQLRFDAAAQPEWNEAYNSIEFQIRPGGDFCLHSDYASKVAENIARMAGVLHAFEGLEGTQISVETLRSAVQIVLWYTAEYMRLFTPPGPADVIRDYAVALDQWLLNYQATTGQSIISRSTLLQLGPNKLRNRDALNVALQRLVDTGRVFLFHDVCDAFGNVKRKGTNRIMLADHHYGKLVRGQQPYNVSPL